MGRCRVVTTRNRVMMGVVGRLKQVVDVKRVTMVIRRHRGGLGVVRRRVARVNVGVLGNVEVGGGLGEEVLLRGLRRLVPRGEVVAMDMVVGAVSDLRVVFGVLLRFRGNL